MARRGRPLKTQSEPKPQPQAEAATDCDNREFAREPSILRCRVTANGVQISGVFEGGRLRVFRDGEIITEADVPFLRAILADMREGASHPLEVVE